MKLSSKGIKVHLDVTAKTDIPKDCSKIKTLDLPVVQKPIYIVIRLQVKVKKKILLIPIHWEWQWCGYVECL